MTLRIATLGAARITPSALIAPARAIEGIEVVAVAARDRRRAEAFAKKHRIPRVLDSYDALLADPEVDAIYIPLPNSHHGIWTIRALEAGKHVLCEKPIAANAEEARAMAEAADRAGRRLMEAFHWRYHPLAERLVTLVREGAIGRITRVETTMCIPLPMRGNIRYRWDLAGGAMMDVGAYAVSMARHFVGEEPRVVSATCTLAKPDIDRATCAELAFPGGATGQIQCSLWSWRLLAIRARLVGGAGEIRAFNPVAPQFGLGQLTIRTASGTWTERFRKPSTYEAQLRAFLAHVREGAPVPTDGWDGVKNMAVIDAVYAAAGLPHREAWSPSEE